MDRRSVVQHYRECSMAYLRESLRNALAQEQYEQAAIIRDEINQRSANEERCITVQKFNQALEDQ
jgi:protein-arginine kinase activator protein McsA